MLEWFKKLEQVEKSHTTEEPTWKSNRMDMHAVQVKWKREQMALASPEHIVGRVAFEIVSSFHKRTAKKSRWRRKFVGYCHTFADNIECERAQIGEGI